MRSLLVPKQQFNSLTRGIRATEDTIQRINVRLREEPDPEVIHGLGSERAAQINVRKVLERSVEKIKVVAGYNIWRSIVAN